MSGSCEIYRIPLKKGAKCEDPHAVVIVDFIKIDGEMVDVCKSSTGLGIDFDKDIYVS